MTQPDPDPTNPPEGEERAERTLNYDNDGDYWLADERRIDERRAMPDPDPTNRELVRVLAEHTSKLSIHTMHQFLAAADAAGYQIVPKVEMERRADAMKVAVCEYLLRVNREHGPTPFIAPTAINWLGDGIVSAALEALDG